jgi:hypothetical protein
MLIHSYFPELPEPFHLFFLIVPMDGGKPSFSFGNRTREKSPFFGFAQNSAPLHFLGKAVQKRPN